MSLSTAAFREFSDDRADLALADLVDFALADRVDLDLALADRVDLDFADDAAAFRLVVFFFLLFGIAILAIVDD